jgi:hypothetical protein
MMKKIVPKKERRNQGQHALRYKNPQTPAMTPMSVAIVLMCAIILLCGIVELNSNIRTFESIETEDAYWFGYLMKLKILFKINDES